MPSTQRHWLAAFLLSVFLGHFGIDRFYLGYVGKGILKLLTFGGLGLWWVYDMIMIGVGKLPDVDGQDLIR